MNVRTLFMSFEGRIGRMQCWTGMVIVGLIVSAVERMFGVPMTTGTTDLRLRLITFVVELISFYPVAAVAVKRLHDRNQPAGFVGLLLAAYAMLLVGDLFGYFDDAAHATLLGGVISAFAAVIGLGFLIELGFRRGTSGPNRYGSDPLAAGA